MLLCLVCLLVCLTLLASLYLSVIHILSHVHVYTCFNDREMRRKKERSKQGQTSHLSLKTCTVCVNKKAPFPFPFRSVPFCYGKTGDFSIPFFPFRSVPFRRLARFRAHVYKFYISRDRPIDRSSAKRQPSFQVA